MSLLLLYKTLHLLCASVLFGSVLSSACYAQHARRYDDAALLAGACRQQVLIDWLLIVPAALLIPLTGLALARVAGWPLSQFWLLWSGGLLGLAGFCWLPQLAVHLYLRRLTRRALEGQRPLPARLGRYLAVSSWLAWLACASLLAGFVLMVVKPL